MKIKNLSYLLIGLLIGCLFPMQSIFADQPIKLIINGQQIQCDVPPQNINGRVLVPARFVAEALGASVEWDGENKVVRITRKDNNIDNNQTIEQKNDNDNSQQPNQEINQPIQQVPPTQSVQTIISNEQNNPTPLENTHPLRLDSVSETTYESIEGTNEKYAFVTVTITNTTDKYIPFMRLTPITNLNDGRNFSSGLYKTEDAQKLNGYFSPNTTFTLMYHSQIPNNIEIVGWKLY